MTRNSLFPLLLVLIAPAAALAQAQVKLERKYAPGDSYVRQDLTKIEQTLSLAGMENVTKNESRTTIRIRVGQADPEGKIALEEKIETLQVSMDANGVQYKFDSADPDNKGNSPLEGLREVHKLVLKTPTVTKLDKDRRVISVEADAALLNSLPPEFQQLAKGQLDPETLKKAANQDLDQLPSGAVKPGETWTRTETTNFGGGQLLTMSVQYTYEGPAEKAGQQLDKITAKAQTVEFSLEPNSPLPFKVKASKLKVGETQGTLLFDRKLGRIVERASAHRVQGELMFDINGMEFPAKLDLAMSNEGSEKK